MNKGKFCVVQSEAIVHERGWQTVAAVAESRVPGHRLSSTCRPKTPLATCPLPLCGAKEWEW